MQKEWTVLILRDEQHSVLGDPPGGTSCFCKGQRRLHESFHQLAICQARPRAVDCRKPVRYRMIGIADLPMGLAPMAILFPETKVLRQIVVVKRMVLSC
jgi:hypothetical protein